jgi:hypothetical protein
MAVANKSTLWISYILFVNAHVACFIKNQCSKGFCGNFLLLKSDVASILLLHQPLELGQ